MVDVLLKRTFPVPDARRPTASIASKVLLAAGVVMVPWIAVLAATLPKTYSAQHWDFAWVGFDALEAVCLVVTAVLFRRGHHQASLASIATATLLLVDGWFDVTTSGREDAFMAVFEAFALELPLAIVCIAAALRHTRPAVSHA